jgi:hypothetical protein
LSKRIPNLAALAEEAHRFRWDPQGYAMWSKRWGEGELADMTGPREWQANINKIIGDHLQSERRHQPLRINVTSGHGIGKSAEIGMLVDWALSTCIDSRVLITANTDTQLRTRTSPEVGIWMRRSISKAFFDVSVMSIKAKAKDHVETWRADFQPWSVHNPVAFQGLHNRRKRLVVIMDEAAGIPDVIWEAINGALTDEDTEIIVLAFGNPNKVKGANWFHETWGRFRHMWVNIRIDSRDVEGTNKQLFQDWLEAYGEESDFFKVRVRGMPPKASSTQLFPVDLIDKCMATDPQSFPHDNYVWGLDIARLGGDRTVLHKRRGFDGRTHKMFSWDETNTTDLIGWLNRELHEDPCDQLFLDLGNTGGAVYDALIKLGHTNVTGVWFGGKPDGTVEGIIVLNKRAEMYHRAKAWMQNPMASLPVLDELKTDLENIEYGFAGDQTSLMLERKEDMRKRGLASPDFSDAFALTFAYPVVKKEEPKGRAHKTGREGHMQTEGWDPQEF